MANISDRNVKSERLATADNPHFLPPRSVSIEIKKEPSSPIPFIRLPSPPSPASSLVKIENPSSSPDRPLAKDRHIFLPTGSVQASIGPKRARRPTAKAKAPPRNRQLAKPTDSSPGPEPSSSRRSKTARSAPDHQGSSTTHPLRKRRAKFTKTAPPFSAKPPPSVGVTFPFQVPRPPRLEISQKACRHWNAKRPCKEQCIFRHVCERCGERDHPVTSCPHSAADDGDAPVDSQLSFDALLTREADFSVVYDRLSVVYDRLVAKAAASEREELEDIRAVSESLDN